MILQKNTRTNKYILYFVFMVLWSCLAPSSVYSNDRIGALFYAIFIVWTLLVYLISTTIFDKSNMRYSMYVLFSYLFFYGYSSLINGRTPSNATFLLLFYMSCFIGLRDDYKFRIFNLFVKIMGIIVMLGMLEYVLFVFIGKSINLGTVLRFQDNIYSRTFTQGLFNLFTDGDTFVRFQCLTEEPGFIGTICGFLIYLLPLKGPNKWLGCIFWIAGMLSFSLAFYVLAFLKFISNIKSMKFAVASLLFLFVFYYFFRGFIDELILNRLFNSETHGDNRSSYIMTAAFISSFENGSLWFGNGYLSHQDLNLEKGVAGAIVWIYQFGIVGCVLMFWAYSKYYFSKCKLYHIEKKESLLFFFAFLLSFYQRQYVDSPYNVVIFFSFPIVVSCLKVNNSLKQI